MEIEAQSGQVYQGHIHKPNLQVCEYAFNIFLKESLTEKTTDTNLLLLLWSLLK